MSPFSASNDPSSRAIRIIRRISLGPLKYFKLFFVIKLVAMDENAEQSGLLKKI